MSNKIFSWGLFLEGFRKTKIVTFIYAGLTLLIQVIIPVSTGLINRSAHHSYVYYYPEANLNAISIWPAIIAISMAPLLMLVLFFAFDRRNTSDFYLALPYTRTCIAVSWSGFAAAFAFLSTVISLLLGWLCCSMFYTIDMEGIWNWLLSAFAAVLFGCGATLIAVSVTGKLLSNIATALLIIFLPRMVLILEKLIITQEIPLLTSSFAPFLNPWQNVYIGGFLQPFSEILDTVMGENINWISNAGQDIYTLIVAALYIVLGIFLFKKRKSETAGQGSVNRTVQAIIRIAVTLVLSLVGTFALRIRGNDDTVVFIAVIFYALALLAFFIYEIITTRKWKNLVKALPSLLIVIALNIIFVLGANVAKNAVLAKTVEPEEIRSVRIISDAKYNSIDYFAKIYNKIEVSDPYVSEKVSEALKQNIEASINNNGSWYSEEPLSNVDIAINTESGTLRRNLMIPESVTARIRKIISSSDEFAARAAQLPDPDYTTLNAGIQGTGENISYYPYYYRGEDTLNELPLPYRMFQTLKEELGKMDAQERAEYLINPNRPSEIYIQLEYYTSAGESVRLYLTEEKFPQTCAMVIEMIAKNMGGIEQAIDELQTISELITENPEYDYAEIKLYICREDKTTGRISEKYIYENIYASGGNGDFKEKLKEIRDYLDVIKESGKEAEMGAFAYISYGYGSDYSRFGGEMLLGLPDEIIIE